MHGSGIQNHWYNNDGDDMGTLIETIAVTLCMAILAESFPLGKIVIQHVVTNNISLWLFMSVYLTHLSFNLRCIFITSQRTESEDHMDIELFLCCVVKWKW